ncbi:hypothetical protein MSAR_37440 [Mycolicibacterium sarraceniae]|uniref:Uncharacterized protein n=1 Tax=Mycolicibacterium sarraceniae TaxID=1534348 RepID=A0A7I7SUX9_9MYCO|nr:hypothetical protein MSAR_37440 [Mycolicibacterium sarraceniae]
MKSFFAGSEAGREEKGKRRFARMHSYSLRVFNADIRTAHASPPWFTGDRISTYPTRTAIEFWQQNNDMLPGLEEVRIAVGYRWDNELREIEAPVVSLRDGRDNVIWAIELSEPAEGEKVSWKPIESTLPTIDLGDLASDTDDDEGEAISS